MTTLGDRIREAIINKQISNYKLSQEINIGRSLLGKYISNESEPSVSNIKLIAEYLGVSIEWLITGKGEMLSYNEVSNIGNNNAVNTITGNNNSNIGNVNNQITVSLPENGYVKIIKSTGEVTTKADCSGNAGEPNDTPELKNKIDRLESENNKLKADLIAAKDKIIALLGG